MVGVYLDASKFTCMGIFTRNMGWKSLVRADTSLILPSKINLLEKKKMVDNKTVKEIIGMSNHKTKESVLNAIEDGILEIYPNKEEYLNAGWDFENENHYGILTDGKIVYFE